MSISPIIPHFNIELSSEEKEIFDEVLKQIEANKRNGDYLTYKIKRDDFLLYTKITKSFQDVADVFIKDQQGRQNSQATITHYQATIKKLCLFFSWKTNEEAYYKHTKEENILIGKLIPIAIFESDSFQRDFIIFLSTVENLNARTIQGYNIDYRAIYYWLAENEFVKQKKIVVRNVEADIKETYTNEEIDKLLKSPSKNCSFSEYRNWVIINWLLATGNRASTILNIRIEDVDLDNHEVRINVQKNKKKRPIALTQSLCRILRKYIKTWLIDEDINIGQYKSEYLFPTSSGEQMSRDGLSTAIRTYNKNRGVEKTSIHLFRHTFCKNWILSGGDLVALRVMLGHNSMEMVSHYANLYGNDLNPKVEQFTIQAQKGKKVKGKYITRNKEK